jgi:hypothetical protein
MNKRKQTRSRKKYKFLGVVVAQRSGKERSDIEVNLSFHVHLSANAVDSKILKRASERFNVKNVCVCREEQREHENGERKNVLLTPHNK